MASFDEAHAVMIIYRYRLLEAHGNISEAIFGKAFGSVVGLAFWTFFMKTDNLIFDFFNSPIPEATMTPKDPYRLLLHQDLHLSPLLSRIQGIQRIVVKRLVSFQSIYQMGILNFSAALCTANSLWSNFSDFSNSNLPSLQTVPKFFLSIW